MVFFYSIRHFILFQICINSTQVPLETHSDECIW